jgi:hypothetical protein
MEFRAAFLILFHAALEKVIIIGIYTTTIS